MAVLLTDLHTHHPPLAGTLAVQAYEAGSGSPLPGGPYTTGLHPWRAQESDFSERGFQEILASITPRTVAIGEIGLDYHSAREEVRRRRQHTWLHRQLELAAERGWPVILHCVKAYNDLLPILPAYPVKAVFHGFTGSPELAAQILAAGHFLSFGASLLNSPKTQQAFKIVPPERLFLETDTSPLPLDEIYRYGAARRGCSVEQLREQLYRNFRSLFNIDFEYV